LNAVRTTLRRRESDFVIAHPAVLISGDCLVTHVIGDGRATDTGISPGKSHEQRQREMTSEGSESSDPMAIHPFDNASSPSHEWQVDAITATNLAEGVHTHGH
jgi:hypothetical protein